MVRDAVHPAADRQTLAGLAVRAIVPALVHHNANGGSQNINTSDRIQAAMWVIVP